MQFEASDAFDLSKEPEKVREAYGTGHFANGCLLARRLSERGVRFIQIYYGNGQPWDTHSKHDEQTRKLAADIDRPVYALLEDLKQRGLLEDTLVIWGGEFGRTPVTENGNGRDHNPHGFTMWMAGGGVRGGMAYGSTDEFGFKAPGKAPPRARPARHGSAFVRPRPRAAHLPPRRRDFRLTDVYGKVAHDVLG